MRQGAELGETAAWPRRWFPAGPGPAAPSDPPRMGQAAHEHTGSHSSRQDGLLWSLALASHQAHTHLFYGSPSRAGLGRETKGTWPQNTELVFLPLRENHKPARLCGAAGGLKELLCSGRRWRGPKPRGGQCRGRQGCSQGALKKKPFFQARPQPPH